MPQLLILRGLRPGQIYTLQEQTNIGNLPEYEIHISDINTALHLVITNVGEQYQITRKLGKEPLLVNGKDVQQSILTNGDLLVIHNCLFLFQVSPADQNRSENSPVASQESEENQLVAFYHISSLVSNILDLKELLHHLAGSLLENFQATTVLIFLQESEQEYLKMVVHKTRLDKVDWKYLKSMLSAKMLSLVTKQKKGVLCRNEYDGNVSYFMVSPLIYQNEILGIVVLEAQQKKQIFVDEEAPKQIFNLSDLYVLGGITLLAATGIANLKRYQERKTHTQRLESLNKITLRLSSLLDASTIYKETAREVCNLLHCSASMVLYLDQEQMLRIGYAVGISKDEAKKFAVPYAKNQIARALQQGRSIVREDIPECFPESLHKLERNSCMIVPVQNRSSGKAEPLGVICVSGRLHNALFSKQDQELLQFIASHLGIALVNASLYEQATVDFLSKVYLRGHFFEKLQDAVTEQNPLALIMLDIDFFKKFNDNYGHSTGDMVLQELGAILKNCIREQDLAGRYGGEEFIIALRDTGNNNALMIAERIRAQIAQANFHVNEQTLHITVSIGVTQYRPPEPVDDLVARCDQTLYLAKNSGRNKVCYA